MSRQPLPPYSPGLPPSLYSGMSSLQINPSGTVTTVTTGASSHASTTQPQKALLKGSKAARHQNRKNEHPNSSSSTPWKDPREGAAASAGHKRTLKDDVSYRQIQASWCPFPPDARATTRKEDDIMVRAAANHIRQTEALGNRMYIEKWGDADRRVSELEAIAVPRQRSTQLVEDMRRDRERYMQGPLLELIATAPDEEIRQLHLRTLDNYRRWQREDDWEDELRHAQ